MAARILPFRSLIPVTKPGELAPDAGALFGGYGQRPSPKVVTMSRAARRRPSPSRRAVASPRLATLEREMAEGYIEVEITGISLRRLAFLYAAIFRGAWAHTLGSVRSILRPTPAL